MNKYIEAITAFDLENVKELLDKHPKWLTWSEKSGKNALHYLCGVNIGNDPTKAEESLRLLKFLLKTGLDINSVHEIPERCGHFQATPLWYAYTRGRNEILYKYLLNNGANPDHCMFAIAWYDDAKAAALFKKHGAKTTDVSDRDTPFLAAYFWKKNNVARWFLENGAEVNVTDEKGNTALYYAVNREYDTDEIRRLLRYGADPDKENSKGISPRMLAERKRRQMMVDLFANVQSHRPSS